MAAIAVHPRPATVGHRGRPDYALVAELVRTLDAPVILSGGLDSPEAVRDALEETGAAAVMLARGSLGNPWLFAQVLGRREGPPGADEVLAELDWIVAGASEHLGAPRAVRYLRRFYPWYIERLGLARARARVLADTVVQSDSFDAVRERSRARWTRRAPERARSASDRRTRRGGPLYWPAAVATHERGPHAEGRHPHPRGAREAPV